MAANRHVPSHGAMIYLCLPGRVSGEQRRRHSDVRVRTVLRKGGVCLTSWGLLDLPHALHQE